MSNSFSFNDVKFQYVNALFQDGELNDSAKVVGACLAIKHFNRELGYASPSLADLARDVGKEAPRTIQRAIEQLENHEWYEVQQGVGRGNYCIFIPHPKRVAAAIELRQKGDKIVFFPDGKRRQTWQESRTTLSSERRQVWQHTLSKREFTKYAREAPAPPPVFVGAIGDIALVEGADDSKIDAWNRWLIAADLPSLQEAGLATTKNGRRIYKLPTTIPPTRESAPEKYRAYLDHLIARIASLRPVPTSKRDIA